MYQIALGDSLAYGGWLVLSGASVAAPFVQAKVFLSYSAGDLVTEQMELFLQGSPAEIAAGLASLERVSQRIDLYARAAHPDPQCLRFITAEGAGPLYAVLHSLSIEVNPNAPHTRQTGSLLVTLHYTRPNWFDGDWVNLPLTGRSGTNVTTGLSLFNHTDTHTTHGNYAFIDKANFDTDLPAPLKIEYKNTTAANLLQDLYLGLYHHLSYASLTPFFHYAQDLIGGTLYSNAAAINEAYRHFTWSATTWTAFGAWPLSNTNVQCLAGLWYRPLLHLYNTHAYTDLSLKLKLQAGSNVLWSGDAVCADPGLDLVLFPPVQVPPNRLLHDALPHAVEFWFYGQHDTAASYTLDIDHLLLLPLAGSAFFNFFYPIGQDAVLVDDNFREIHVTNYTPSGAETVAQVRQGAGLFLHPGANHILIFVQVDDNQDWEITRTGSVTISYRPRRRSL